MLQIRGAQASDAAGWRALWAGYLAFYKTPLPEAVSTATWERILNPASPVFCTFAERDGEVIGFAVCVLHEATWVTQPVCYLEDLFVAPGQRGAGIGRALIEDLQTRARNAGWSRLYWHTGHDNPARKLYDEFVMADDFVRYRITLD